MFDLDGIKLAIEFAKKHNATELTQKFHKCGELEGWCVELTVRKHYTCEDEEDDSK